MSRKSLLTLAVATLVLAACNRQAQAPTPTPVPTVATQEEINNVRTELEQLTGQRTPSPVLGQTDTASKETVLKPQEGIQGTGYARQEFANNQYKLTVLADLPDLNSGETYQVWLQEQSNSPADQARKVGMLKTSKSGYLLDYGAREDLTRYKYFIISREKTNDNQIETQVLTGQID